MSARPTSNQWRGLMGTSKYILHNWHKMTKAANRGELQKCMIILSVVHSFHKGHYPHQNGKQSLQWSLVFLLPLLLLHHPPQIPPALIQKKNGGLSMDRIGPQNDSSDQNLLQWNFLVPTNACHHEHTCNNRSQQRSEKEKDKSESSTSTSQWSIQLSPRSNPKEETTRQKNTLCRSTCSYVYVQLNCYKHLTDLWPTSDNNWPPTLIGHHHNMIYEPYRLSPIAPTNVNTQIHAGE
jgi:hypothetical protein